MGVEIENCIFQKNYICIYFKSVIGFYLLKTNVSEISLYLNFAIFIIVFYHLKTAKREKYFLRFTEERF